MAYVSKEFKDSVAPKLRALAKQFGLTATVAVRNHSTLVLNVSKGEIDFVNNYADTVRETNHWAIDKEKDYQYNSTRTYMQVSHHWTDKFSGSAKEFLDAAFAIMNNGNHDNSDSMTDYFDVGWYCDINIGKWDKPYEIVK